jgi:hypothetical protein
MKKYRTKYFILLLLSLFCFSVNSQNDIINTIKGEKINCTITKEDSARVYFKIGGNISKVDASIARSEIRSIEYAPKQAPTPPTLSMNPNDVAKDEYVVPKSELSPTVAIIPLSKKTFNTAYFKIGMSLPIGEFEKNKIDTNGVGPGMPGQIVDIGFSHFAKKNIGINVSGFYAQNEVNTVPIRAKYKQKTDSDWVADKAYWRAIGINVGILTYKELNDFLIFAKLNMGYLSLKHPELKLSISSLNYLQYQTVSSDAISLSASIGGSYKILENLDLTMEFSYLRAKCKFSEVLILGEEPTSGFPKKISITQRDVIQKYHSIFSSIGLSYRF